jgi:uncharacterized membrane protein YeaQ/YmgE (transglycosylase-associated protein family)
MLSASQILTWIIVGVIGGTLAGYAITWKRGGLGWWRNLFVGLAGAIVGGLVFWTFGILKELDAVSVSLRDIIAAVAGSLIVLVAVWLWQRFAPHRAADDASFRSG